MSDPWSSAEAMLRWQSAQLRANVLDSQSRVNSLPVLYPLPKPTDGLPDNWSFGNETPDSLSRVYVKKGLNQAVYYLDKCDLAIAADDHPKAIFCLMQAVNCQHSAWAQWSSSASVKTWRYIDARRKKLAKHATKANKMRVKYSEADKARWLAELINLMQAGRKKSDAATLIAKREKLPMAAVSTIRRLLD